MDPRRLLATLLALLTGAVFLVALPASAAPEKVISQPCVASYERLGGTIAPSPDPGGGHSLTVFDNPVYEPGTVTDVDVTYEIAHPDAANVSLHVIGPKTQPNLTPSIQTYNAGMASGELNGRFAFDDEAGTSTISGTSPPSGTYLPATPASGLEGVPGRGTWSLWVLNYSSAAATLKSFSVTLTYATCDEDVDGVDDFSDNCLGVHNPDQANRDDDALGDACDLDIDGDAVANAADGCQLVAAATGSGCPPAARSARLSYVKKKKGLQLAVRSDAAGCRDGARATLFRKRPGRDTKLVTGTTDRRGRYRFAKPRAGGKFYVRVARSYATGEAECATARSKPVRVRR